MKWLTLDNISLITILVIGLWWIWIVIRIAQFSVMSGAKETVKLTGRFIGKRIKLAEDNYQKNLKTGRIKHDSTKRKFYALLNDLTIDLGLKAKGATPYELLFFLIVLTSLVSIGLSIAIKSFTFGITAYPVVFVGMLCITYTRANVAHTARISAIVEAENIICNSIGSGIKVAVRDNLDSFPKEVVSAFRDYLNELDENIHPVTALRNLNAQLGSVSDYFISKCIKYEMHAEAGTASTFQDIVEINADNTAMRIKVERVFEDLTNEFVLCLTLIGIFFIGVLAVYPFIRALYIETILGRMVLLGDLLILVFYFVVLTYSRAHNYYGT